MLIPKPLQLYRSIRLFKFYFGINYLQTLLGNLVYLYDSLAEHYHLHNNEPIRKRNYRNHITGVIKILMASTITSMQMTTDFSSNLVFSAELLTLNSSEPLPALRLARNQVAVPAVTQASPPLTGLLHISTSQMFYWYLNSRFPKSNSQYYLPTPLLFCVFPPTI